MKWILLVLILSGTAFADTDKANVEITRHANFIGILRKMRVFVDDNPTAVLTNGSTARLNLAPGHHSIYTQFLGLKSLPLDLSINNGDSIKLESGLPESGKYAPSSSPIAVGSTFMTTVITPKKVYLKQVP